ncbi:MAG: hypothetical protein V1936_01895 [Patescibacteria group bacterium]
MMKPRALFLAARSALQLVLQEGGFVAEGVPEEKLAQMIVDINGPWRKVSLAGPHPGLTNRRERKLAAEVLNEAISAITGSVRAKASTGIFGRKLTLKKRKPSK